MLESVVIANEASFGPSAQRLEGLKAVNFIYGANGSGKTTISRVIAGSADFPHCALSWSGGRSMERMVYNREFVEKNYSARLPGIFTLGEGNREALDRIAECKGAIEKLEKDISDRRHTLGGEDDQGGKKGELQILRERFEDDCWTIKARHDAYFQDAFTGYRHSKAAFADKVLEEEQSNRAEAIDLELLKSRVATVFEKGLQSERLLAALPSDHFERAESDPILAKRVIGKDDVDVAALIRKLGNSDWVKQGIEYLAHSEGDCPFCQQNLPHDIQDRLSEYFDETYSQDIAAIDLAIDRYRSQASSAIAAIERMVDEQPKYLDIDATKVVLERLKERTEANQRRLESKKKEPSSPTSLESSRPLLIEVAQLIGEANGKAEAQNQLLHNLTTERALVVSQVWRCVTDDGGAALSRFNDDRRGVEAAIANLRSTIAQKQAEIATYRAEINSLERSITSVEPTVAEINKILASFGFRGFSLGKAPGSEPQYEIIRPDGSNAALTLSEGEKTFVTFLYFYHLLRGSSSESGITNDRVVVIDDPVSSLDSDILFIVASLIKRLLDEACEGAGLIKQVILLTHNIYFHRQVSYDPRRRAGCMNHETFWTVKKREEISLLERHQSNPIKTSYELLWAEVRDPNRSKLTIQNTLRRILENYFKILGNLELNKITDKFDDGNEKMICAALLSWAHDGSHNALDDLYLTSDEATVEKYLVVFRKIFEKSDHEAHYIMMMGDAETPEPQKDQAVITAFPA